MGRKSKKKPRPIKPMPPEPRHEGYVAAAVCVLLIAAVWMVFGQPLDQGFVYDDQEYICTNRHVTCGLTGEAIRWALTNSYSNNWHPVSWLSHMLDCSVYGFHAGGHHLTNVLLHAANAVLLFLVLWRMAGALWPAAFVAAVFAIHPLKAESVAWVTERKDVLSGLFFMLTLAAYVGYVRHRPSFVRYLAVALLFALGLMSKPMLVTLPFVLLLLDYWPLGRVRETHQIQVCGAFHAPYGFTTDIGYLLLEKLPLFALAAASCAVTPLAQTHALVGTSYLPFSWRVANALDSYVAYLIQFFYPVWLVAFYPHPGPGLPSWKPVVAFLLLAAISVAVWAWRKRQPWLPVGWFWYLGMLVPVIGLVQVGLQARADRYMYLPQIGLCIALTYGIHRASASWPYRRWICGSLASVAIAVLMVLACRQTSYWHDSGTLWTHALQYTRPNATALNNLAWARATSAEPRFRNGIQAVALAEQLVHLTGRYSPNYLDTLAAAYAEAGRFPEAILAAEEAISLAVAQRDAQMVQSLRDKLSLYRSGLSYHEPPDSSMR